MSIRMRHTQGHSKNRRSHHALEGERLSKDSKGNPHLRHRATLETGEYRGRVVLGKKSDSADAEKTNKAAKSKK